MPQTEQAELDPKWLFVELTCTSILEDSDPAERHCRHYEGRLVTEPGEDGEEVATFSYMDFDLTIHGQLGQPRANDLAHMVMDAQSGDTLDAFHAIEDNLGHVSDVGWVNRVVYLKRLVVHPPYRGQGIARWWLAWILDHVGFGDASSVCVAVTPYPIDDDGRTIDHRELTPGEKTTVEERRERLVALYESARFKQLGNTDVWGLGLAFERPDPRAR